MPPPYSEVSSPTTHVYQHTTTILRESKFLQIEGQVLIKGEIITKIEWGHLKSHWARKAQIYIKASFLV
jgi:hypothetical protein